MTNYFLSLKLITIMTNYFLSLKLVTNKSFF